MNMSLIGADGSMGNMIAMLAEAAGHRVVVKIDESNSGASASGLAAMLKESDVAIDFTVAEAVKRNVEACMLAEVPLVEGTTGWNAERPQIEELVNESGGSMVFGANFSIGVNIFYRIVDHTAELFSKFSPYEVFIEEQHHSRKKDAPSGTALKLKEIVARHIAGEFSVAATRAGNIPGTHRVGFDGPADQIVLEHVARSREGFARGALLAAEWIVGKRGFFEFSDVIDEVLREC